MNRTLLPHERLRVATLLDSIKAAQCVEAVVRAGGRVFLVGGAVRDLMMGVACKDIDLEVHGLDVERLTAILEQYGTVNAVGKSFGVLKFRAKGDVVSDVDWSLPRSDSAGRKPTVAVDVNMSIDQALRRRDLTMNAMAIDVTTHQLHDPFGGEEDLKAHVLRAPDAVLFVEDPLRFFRVMQFIGRFDADPDAALSKICASMDVAHVSRERIEEEMKKLLLKSRTPSRAFRWLKKIGCLYALFPELAALVTTQQSPVHHPEGDVFEHTMQVLDAAADIRSRISDEREQLIVMYAALCHDLGKATTTELHPGGKVTSYGHEVEGVALTKSLLARVSGNKEVNATVAKLVRYHMDPGNFVAGGAKLPAYKRLAVRLAPETNCATLALLVEADRRGRNGAGHTPLPTCAEGVEEFLEQAKKAAVLLQPEPAVLKGADLLDAVAPGPKLGELVRKAYEIQLNEGIKDKAELRRRVLGTRADSE